MTGSQIFSAVVAVLLGGGLVAAVAQVVSARTELRKIRADEDKLPAEVESLWLGGAEKAVSALQAALDRAERQVTFLERLLDRRDRLLQQREERIDELEGQLIEMRGQLEQLRRRLDDLGGAITDLKTDGDADA